MRVRATKRGYYGDQTRNGPVMDAKGNVVVPGAEFTIPDTPKHGDRVVYKNGVKHTVACDPDLVGKPLAFSKNWMEEVAEYNPAVDMGITEGEMVKVKPAAKAKK